MTLFIHIGSHKTGTTSLQSFISVNRDAFKSAGLAYLTFGLHAPAANEFATLVAENEGEKMAAAIQLMKNQKADAPDSLISAENLFSVSPATFSMAVRNGLIEEGEKIKIICYVRRQDEYLESLYLQRLRNGRTKASVGKFVNNRMKLGRGKYTLVLDAWKDAFPEAEIVVRIYEKSKLKGGDTITDALSIMGYDNVVEIPEKAEISNTRANRDLYDILAYLAAKTNFDIGKVNKYFTAITTPDTGAGHKLLSDAQREEIFKFFEEENKDLAERYLEEDHPVFSSPANKPSDNISSFSNNQIEFLNGIFSALDKEVASRHR